MLKLTFHRKYTAAVLHFCQKKKKDQEVLEVQGFMTTSQSVASAVLMIDESVDKPLLSTCGFNVGLIWSDTVGGDGIN